jgi:PAS domain S-box-containing protein
LADRKKNWFSGLSVHDKGMLVILLPVATSLVCSAVFEAVVFSEFREIDKHWHARLIQDSMASLIKSGIDIALILGRYHISHNNEFLQQYDEHEASVRNTLHELRANARGNEVMPATRFCQDTEEALALSRQIKEELPKANGMDTIDSVLRMKKLRGKLVQMQNDIEAFENEIRATNSPRWLEDKIKNLMLELTAAIILSVVAAFTAMRAFTYGIVDPLRTMLENTFRLARSEQLLPPIGGSDEISHLDRVFHDMANALAEASHKERAVIQHAIDVICSIDGEGRFTALSPAALQVFGFAPEELIGRKFTELVATDDLGETLSAFERIKSEETEPVPIENRVVRKNGDVVHILWSAYWAPGEQSMFCVAHDITERKQAEEQLKASEARVRSIFESAPVALLVIDNGGIIRLVNPKAETMFGYSWSEIIDKPVSMLLPQHPEFEADKFSHQAVDALLGRVNELTAQTSTGRLMEVELTLERYQTAGGEQVLAAMLDVSERHEIERLKREFVSTVSHELRTPLTAIRGSLTLLAVGALGQLGEQADKAVKIAERNCLRLINLINDLLDIEKLEAGKLEMVFEDTALQPVIDKAVESVRAFAEQYEVTIDVAVQPAVVHADGDRIVQVLVNLLSNAIKYSPRGEHVSLQAVCQSQSLRVSVSDRGRGIPASKLDKVFERFEQVESADAKKRGGTGLGLAICKAIVLAHKGAIGVSSQEGKGSTFWFELPLAENNEQSSTTGADNDDDHILVVRPAETVAEERS